MAIEKANSRSDEISNKVRHQWNRIAGKYVKNEVLLNDLFSEIQNAYESGGRFYHTLEHIYELLMLSDTFRNNLKDKDIVDFAIFYHDIVYSPTRNDNEQRSADLALKRLSQLQFSEAKIPVVVQYIHATKNHELSRAQKSHDIAWFLDFDMSILGTDPATYRRYTENVRLEYRIYPDLLYNRGRKKFLQQTFRSHAIFHTPEFRTSFESQARVNMKEELERLA